MESMPVVGVEVKKAKVALLEAPSRLKVAATGITPQEQRGRGIPKRVAFKMAEKPLLPKCLDMNFSFKKT
jgi:hypothetical protein